MAETLAARPVTCALMSTSTGERFLVTGAHGCIGTWVVRCLVADGADVTAFDLDESPRRWTLAMSAGEIAAVRRVRGDIADLAALERALDEHGIERVIH